ncbi:MAG: sugar O-acetyltransferase [Saccharospirillum sp.]
MPHPSSVPPEMPSHYEQMLAGEPYDATDAELLRLRRNAQALTQRFNQTQPHERVLRHKILRELLEAGAKTARIEPPFHCDYGRHIRLGKHCFINVNCVILDACPVTLGDHCLLGPGVQLYTATHPLDAVQRRDYELARPITLGSDVWLGGGVIVCPGVRIGDRAVIGAGSVVTRDIPADVVAAGNPCRVLRPLQPEDSF